MKAVLTFGLLFLVGCASNAMSRYYVLSPMPGDGHRPQEACFSIGIGPIKLPEYVNRPELVTRTSQNALVLAYFDLWAEPLSDAVPRILAENITRLICTKEVSLFPWKPAREPDYRVEVEVLHMDGNLGQTFTLEAWWNISARGEKRVIVTKRSSYREAVAGLDYDALIQAYSRALAALSHDIASALKDIRPDGQHE
jgi:uncharacterized lipoprotein YmbA